MREPLVVPSCYTLSMHTGTGIDGWWDRFEDRYGLFWHCSVGNYKQEYYRDFCDLKRDHSFQM